MVSGEFKLASFCKITFFKKIAGPAVHRRRVALIPREDAGTTMIGATGARRVLAAGRGNGGMKMVVGADFRSASLLAGSVGSGTQLFFRAKP